MFFFMYTHAPVQVKSEKEDAGKGKSEAAGMLFSLLCSVDYMSGGLVTWVDLFVL